MKKIFYDFYNYEIKSLSRDFQDFLIQKINDYNKQKSVVIDDSNEDFTAFFLYIKQKYTDEVHKYEIKQSNTKNEYEKILFYIYSFIENKKKDNINLQNIDLSSNDNYYNYVIKSYKPLYDIVTRHCESKNNNNIINTSQSTKQSAQSFQNQKNTSQDSQDKKQKDVRTQSNTPSIKLSETQDFKNTKKQIQVVDINQTHVNQTFRKKDEQETIQKILNTNNILKSVPLNPTNMILLDYQEAFKTAINMIIETNKNLDLEQIVNHDNMNLIQQTCQYGRLEIFKYLADEKQFPLDVRTQNGFNLLHIACQYGHLQIVQYIIDNYKEQLDINITTPDGFTPLHLACQYEHLPIVLYLRDNGANLNAQTKEGLTPYSIMQSLINKDNSNANVYVQMKITAALVSGGNIYTSTIKPNEFGFTSRGKRAFSDQEWEELQGKTTSIIK